MSAEAKAVVPRLNEEYRTSHRNNWARNSIIAPSLFSSSTPSFPFRRDTPRSRRLSGDGANTSRHNGEYLHDRALHLTAWPSFYNSPRV